MDTHTSVRQRTILRNMAVTFCVLTAVLLALIGYVGLSRAEVMVTLGSVPREVTFRLTLAEEVFGRTRSEGSLAATFLETAESAEGVFVPSGTGEPTGKAGGLVAIQNNADRPQSLVATTRLLTPEGLLFRLKDAVRVPARGSISVAVEADQEGPSGEVGPTRFTIPGLSQSLQAQIFAISSTPMVRGGAEAKTVTAQDLETARQTLRQQVLTKVRPALSAVVNQQILSDDDFITSVSEEQASSPAGTAARSFTMALKFKVVAVAFSKDEMLKRAAAAVGSRTVPELQGVRYVIGAYDPVQRTATLSGRATVGASLDRGSSIFAPENFVGATPDEVKTFLKNYEGVKDVAVKISPYWQRHLPRLPSRIKVEFRTE